MNLDEAVTVHQKWKVRLSMIIEGHSADALDPLVVELDNHCELGKWLQGEGRVHHGRAEFGSLVAEHAAFHKQAGAVLRKALKGDLASAKVDLDHAYYQQSQKTVMAIIKLKKALQ